MIFAFTFDRYYPVGGVNDLLGKYKDKLEAYEAIRNANKYYTRHEKYQLTDETLEIVETGYCENLGGWLETPLWEDGKEFI